MFVLKHGGTILLALNEASVRLVSSGVGNALESAVIVKYGIRGCQRFQQEVSCLETAQPAFVVSRVEG